VHKRDVQLNGEVRAVEENISATAVIGVQPPGLTPGGEPSQVEDRGNKIADGIAREEMVVGAW
jgi:hypothetical protein